MNSFQLLRAGCACTYFEQKKKKCFLATKLFILHRNSNEIVSMIHKDDIIVYYLWVFIVWILYYVHAVCTLCVIPTIKHDVTTGNHHFCEETFRIMNIWCTNWNIFIYYIILLRFCNIILCFMLLIANTDL